MARRAYDQYCPVAKGLDVIGDRWALLVIRDLLLGPARYSDLLRGLPGIATDILTRRLRELEQDGVVTRRVLPPPAATTVYELTDRGERLREPLMAIARWGMELLPPPGDPSAFTPTMIANALQVVLRPADDEELEFAVVAGGEEFAVDVRGGEARARRGRAGSPVVTVRGEPGAIVAAFAGDDASPAGVDFEGDRSVLDRLRRMVVVPGATGRGGRSATSRASA